MQKHGLWGDIFGYRYQQKKFIKTFVGRFFTLDTQHTHGTFCDSFEEVEHEKMGNSIQHTHGTFYDSFEEVEH